MFLWTSRKYRPVNVNTEISDFAIPWRDLHHDCYDGKGRASSKIVLSQTLGSDPIVILQGVSIP